MTSPEPLAVSALYRPCQLANLAFSTTDELPILPDTPGVLGQDRAAEAVEFGVGLRAPGYNIYVVGDAGLGKRTMVRDMLGARVGQEEAPADWCYVNNFKQPYKPRALRLPRGQGVILRSQLKQFAEDVRASIPALFDGDEYRNRAEQIDAEVTQVQQQAFEQLGEEASQQGIALVHTPGGFSLAPVSQDEVMTPEQFAQLPDEERERLGNDIIALQERLQKVIRQVQQLQKEKRRRIKDLGREMSVVTVGAMLDEVRATAATLPEVVVWLNELQSDVLENLDEFRRTPETETNPFRLPQDDSFFNRYGVNVVVGEEGAGVGAPVVIEDNPTYQNLLGRVEYQSRFGTLITDFNQIKPGALHRANGGYLLLDASRLLGQPFAWDGLKRALRTREIRTEPLGQTYGLINTAALEPEPIPLDVKVVLFGESLLYYLLLEYDPEFGELFRVQADFEEEIDRSDEHEELYARLVATVTRREGWLPLQRDAVARVIERASRLAGDAERLSTHLEGVTQLLQESQYRASRANSPTITAEHVQAAIESQRRRSGRIEEQVRKAIRRGELLIDTSGQVVGQVNGLSVALSTGLAFAFPTRITANTRLGDGEVADIQREVELSGPIHSKGVLILASLLSSRYSPDRPPSLSATLVFEQTYGAVDGDSASVAELCALLSSLGGFGMDQGLAVTGAIDQHGRVLPIGAVNEKIEGFFDACAARGLTGSQGVVIPHTNVKHLMLRQDVVAAVARNEFRIFGVSTVDEALSILSGLEAGVADESGAYPEGTANALVAERLLDLSAKRLLYAQAGMMMQRVSTPRSAKAAHRRRRRNHVR